MSSVPQTLHLIAHTSNMPDKLDLVAQNSAGNRRGSVWLHQGIPAYLMPRAHSVPLAPCCTLVVRTCGRAQGGLVGRGGRRVDLMLRFSPTIGMTHPTSMCSKWGLTHILQKSRIGYNWKVLQVVGCKSVHLDEYTVES
eukprot:5211960-Pleurochrysis_carterae.AAC.2